MELLGSQPGADAADRDAAGGPAILPKPWMSWGCRWWSRSGRLVLARVHKVNTPEELRRIADELFEETDLVLAQKFLPTEFDWRVGVLGGSRCSSARPEWRAVTGRS